MPIERILNNRTPGSDITSEKQFETVCKKL